MFPCTPGEVVDSQHGSRVIARCNRWQCENCGPSKRNALIAEIASVREHHGGMCVYSVLTFRHIDGRAVGRAGTPLARTSIQQLVRRWYGIARSVLGTEARCTVVEFGKRGRNLHFNVVWFGVRRDYFDCTGRKSNGRVDARLWCGACSGCRLRKAWTSVSGAERSTHEVTHGNVASYVAKYLMKELDGSRPEGWKRFSWSRSAKRPPVMVPAYRYITNRLKDTGNWIWGERQDKNDVEGRDYLAASRVWHGSVPTWRGSHGSEGPAEGLHKVRRLCSGAHSAGCDTVPYWSKSRIRAWGGVDAVWRWIGDRFGGDTLQMLHERIIGVWHAGIPRLEYMSDAYAGHF